MDWRKLDCSSPALGSIGTNFFGVKMGICLTSEFPFLKLDEISFEKLAFVELSKLVVVELIKLVDVISRWFKRKMEVFSWFDSVFVEEKLVDTFSESESDLLSNIDFIKIDTEGYEYFILKGGEQTIKTYKPIIQLEFNETNMRQCNLYPKQLYNYIMELGYKIHNLTNEELIIVPNSYI